MTSTSQPSPRQANGDMLQYFADHPAKLKEKQERDKAKGKKAGMDHNRAISKLQREFSDWEPGDLMDAVRTTSPRPSRETAKVQDRYWELRGGRPGPMPGEWDFRNNRPHRSAAERVARAYIRRAFNKENGPELMAQLLKVLHKKDLRDAENQIRMKKIPQLVDKAWASVSASDRKMARLAQMKLAGDIRRILYPLFERLSPYVKDTRRFLTEVAENFTLGRFPGYGHLNWGVGGKSQIIDWEHDEAQGEMIYRQTLESPSEYAEHEFGWPTEVAVHLISEVDFRMWPISFAKEYRKHITDPDGFGKAVTDLVGNGGAVKMLGKLALASIRGDAKHNGYMELFSDVEDEVYDEIWDAVNDEFPGMNVRWEWGEKGKITKAWFKTTGVGLEMHVQMSVEGTDGEAEYEAPEPDYDDYDRYASKAKEWAKAMREGFEAEVKEWESLAGKVWAKVKTGENALNFAYELAEDINWHSLNRTGLLGGGDAEDYYELGLKISTYGQAVDWGLESAAGLIVALLRKAGETARARAVKRYALKEFPDSWEG